MSRACGTQAGFTLTEAVMVIVIVVMLATVALPRFFEQSVYQQQLFYSKVLNAARYAQKYAFTTGCDVQFSVDASGYAATQRATGCTAGAFTLAVRDPADPTRALSDAPPAGVALSMTTGPVVFKASGLTGDSTTRTITVASRSFSILGTTGYVREP